VCTTLQAMLPEKYQPAWGTMPATNFSSGSITAPCCRKSRISYSQSFLLAGYQLPAKTAFLTAIVSPPFAVLERGINQT